MGFLKIRTVFKNNISTVPIGMGRRKLYPIFARARMMQINQVDLAKSRLRERRGFCH